MKHRIGSLVLGIIGLVGLFLHSNIVLAQQGDPENPYWYNFKPWGEMNGMLTPNSCGGRDESFGYETVASIGKIGKQQAWVISRYRCDTAIFEWNLVNTSPLELLLYRAVKNGLPTVTSGQRIGPDEINYATSFIAAGDFDNDGYVDIVTTIRLLNDTSYKNYQGFPASDVVIWWGDSVGSYTTKDTTHLSCGHRKWGSVNSALNHGIAVDLSSDGIDDLVLPIDAGYDSGTTFSKLPEIQVFLGGNHTRWGRGQNPPSRMPSWSWWTIPDRTNSIRVLDHDCDGHSDIAFIKNGLPGTVSILYGDPRGLPDTADLQTIQMDTINGRAMEFADVTGDGVPELIANCGGPELLRIYAGKAGQRLIDQFGRGLAPPDPDHGRPWSLPWAEIWLPKRINQYWEGAGFNGVWTIGDINQDGISDIGVYSPPFLCFYTGGSALDSLIDGEIDTRGMGFVYEIFPMGDIDGSGVTSFALVHGSRPGGVLFYKTSNDVPTYFSSERRLPHPLGFRCEHAAETPRENSRTIDSARSMNLSCTPNPTGNKVRLKWRTTNEQSTIILSTEQGSEARRLVLPRGIEEYQWDTSGWISGLYFATVQSGSLKETINVVVQ